MTDPEGTVEKGPSKKGMRLATKRLRHRVERGGLKERLKSKGERKAPFLSRGRKDLDGSTDHDDFYHHTPEYDDTGDVADNGSIERKSYAYVSSASLLDDLRKVVACNIRRKPTYADSWIIGGREDLAKIAEYDVKGHDVFIGIASDGEMEYNIMPIEYGCANQLSSMAGEAIERVRKEYRGFEGRPDRQDALIKARRMLKGSSNILESLCGKDVGSIESTIEDVCEMVYRYTIGLGIFDILLSDPKLEDIYIDAPCERNRIHVTMNGIDGVNSHVKCRTNIIVDKKEVLNLINVLKRESGLQFCESSPILETDIRTHDARATIVGYPMSPNGNAVAIRKHSTKPWTLSKLIANKTIEPKMAGLLSFLIDNRSTFLICGARGAGKSSLLSALMFEFPTSQRILTIEDTLELPGTIMRRMGYKVQSMLIDDRMGGDSLSRTNEALRVSLRMGESAIVLGEVRGEEAKTLYQSMRTGRAGSSILGTIHGDSAKSVYDRVVYDIGIAPEAFMATEVIAVLSNVRDKRTGNHIRKVKELMATGDSPGAFLDMSNNDLLFESPAMRRAMSTSQLTRAEVLKDIRARALIRAFLADMGRLHGEGYFGPEWIGVANDHVMRVKSKTSEECLDSFKARFERMTGLRGEAHE